jgi:hypothetical protein
MKDVTKRRRRLAPRGLWISFTIFILAVAILGHWLGLSAYPANAGAPLGPVASKRMPLAAKKPESPPSNRSTQAFDISPTALPELQSPTTGAETPPTKAPSQCPEGEASPEDLWYLRPPIVPGATPLEAWPESRIPEESIDSIPPYATATPLESGNPAASRPEHTTPIGRSFADALVCAGLGGICWMMRYRLARI